MSRLQREDRPIRNCQRDNPAATEAALDAPFPDGEFREPLVQALTHLAHVAQLHLVVDQKALDAADVQSDTPVDVRVHRVSARRALRAILDGATKIEALAYYVEGDCVHVSNAVDVPRITRAYGVSDLPGLGKHNVDPLLNMIVTAANPTNYSSDQEIAHMLQRWGNQLIITQSYEGHLAIEELFKKIRLDQKK